LKIICYPHITLRHKSKPVRRVDDELRQIVRTMFQLMYKAKGVGLAANQVDLPLRLFVVNLEGDPEKGEELVFINPLISQLKGSEEQEEGCLSLPGLYGNVIRPKQVRITAYNMRGEEVTFAATGLLARVVQHELDHLDGVLFIDRMKSLSLGAIQDTLEEFKLEFESRRGTGEIPDEPKILAQLDAWEKRYC